MFFEKLKEKIRTFDLFELGNSAILYYLLIFYLLPIAISLGISGRSIIYQPNYKALFFLAIGLIALIVGYFNNWPSRVVNRLPIFLKRGWNFRNVSYVFIFTFVLGLLVKLFRILTGVYSHLGQNPAVVSGPFYSLIGFLDWFSYIALIIAFGSYFYLHSRRWQWIAYGVFVLELLYALPSCSKMNVIIPIVLYVIVRHYTIGIKYWKVLLIVLAIFLFLFPYSNYCRSPQVLNSYDTKDLIVDSSLGRIGQTEVFSRIIEKFPADFDFLYGRSLAKFFISLGPPKFIWKDKPAISSGGNEFGHQVGLIGPNDFQTSIGPTIVGDWYMNFGLIGIIVGMFLMGFLWRTIYLYFIKKTDRSLSGVLIYGIFWILIIKGMENEIAPVYAGLVKLFVMLIVVHIFLTLNHPKLIKRE